MKELSKPKNLQARTLDKMEQANQTVAEYQQQGCMLTLRQLYNQFQEYIRSQLNVVKANFQANGV